MADCGRRSTRCSSPTDLFGDCGPALAAVGTPSPTASRALATLVSACTRLEHASGALPAGDDADEPTALLAATRASLAAAPLLARARLELAALGPRSAGRYSSVQTGVSPERRVARRTQYSRVRFGRLVAGGVVWAFVLGNVVAIVWIWIANHNLDFSFAPDYWATLMARLGGLTGLLAAFTALVQVLLLARLPFLGRLIGFDRLTVWHRWNGYLCLLLVLAHTVMAVLGFSLDGNKSFFGEFWKLVADNILTGMVTATIGLALFLLVTVSSVTIARRHLPYELWYAVHLTAYAAIALAWFHQIPTGGDINPTFHPNAATYWRVLFFGTLALLAFRVLTPIVSAFRYRLRVAEVIAEGPKVTTMRMTGRRLDRMGARPGQFFLWRFLTGGFWWTAHPFSLSAAPTGGRSGSASRRQATTRRGCGRSRSGRGSSPRARTGSSPPPPAGAARRS